MRKAPKKKSSSNKFIFSFVIILVLITVFAASFVISYNLMGPGNTNAENTEIADEYQQPEDMLGGSKNENDKLKDLRKENAELKGRISELEVQNAELRNELEMITATLENQNFVQQNGSATSESNNSSEIDTSETGL